MYVIQHKTLILILNQHKNLLVQNSSAIVQTNQWFEAPVSSEAWVRIPPLPPPIKTGPGSASQHSFKVAEADRGRPSKLT